MSSCPMETHSPKRSFMRRCPSFASTVKSSKANVKGKDKVSTCLNLVDDALVDTPSAAALSVQVPSVAPSPVDTSNPVVPTYPPTSYATHLSPVDASEPVAPNSSPSVCAAKDAQPCSQVTAVGSEEWHIVGKRRHNSGTKRQSPPPLHAEGNLPAHHNVANNAPSNQQARQHVSKGKAPASSVDITGTKTLQRPRSAYARIIVFWNPETVKVDMLHFSAQGIHVMVTSLVQQFYFTATFIYGFNTITARRDLWEDLRRWGPDAPWLLLGDFNSILSQEDKHNGEPVSTYETSDFRNCCSDLGIDDLNSIGSHFTWTNGNIWTKIDRFMANNQWFNLQQIAHVHFGNPGAFSDHSPSTVQLGSRELCGKRNFKFFNMWAGHPQFLETISQHWSLDIYGSHMYILCNKLKHLKGRLKTLNNLHFSHISERVARAGKELDDTQLLLQNDMDNGDLLALEKQQRLNLVNLKSVEKMFFGQKLKCSFFKDGDKGTRFFHSLMSQRHKRHHISAIVRSDGILTFSAEEVGKVFVAYYKYLLGTAKNTIPPRVDVVQRGNCINANSHEFLLALVSVDDIKRVLFSMDDNKAPGPDGYTSAFFKKSWSIVGEDLCSAVKDFFASREILKQINHSTITLVPKSANGNTAADYRPISCCNVT
ncbi:hypothetical protein NC651_032856 [Populus alba x Populus x berolinensis]|nr:hypothetical protein NC651_032856 [Populus alba x Populus x berolinensis]